MKNSFSSGENLEGTIRVDGIEKYRHLNVTVNARVVGWLKIKLTDTNEDESSTFKNSLFAFGKNKTIEYKNNRRIFRYPNS